MIPFFFPPQVSDLKENKLYQFQVRAANIAGVGIPSLPSQTFKCEEWTIAVPGEWVCLYVEEFNDVYGLIIIHYPVLECIYLSKMYLYTGPPHDLQVLEVRKDSLVLLWKPPVYQGRSEVNGYYVDIKEADADFEKWRGVNEKATSKTYMKVCLSVIDVREISVNWSIIRLKYIIYG